MRGSIRKRALCGPGTLYDETALPEPGTLNPEPGTRNLEPGTRNPEPGTLKP
jgi:hypothetical protein